MILTIYDKITIEELYSFVVVRTTATVKAQAEQGMHDDLVMSLAIAWQLYQTAEFSGEYKGTLKDESQPLITV